MHGRHSLRSLLAALLTLAAVLALPAVASAAVLPTNDAGALTGVFADQPGIYPGGAAITTPPAGTPNGVTGDGIAGFPVAGDSFAILSTGNAAAAPGDQTTFSSSDDGGGAIHTDGNERDVSVLKLPVAVPGSANCLSFALRFASEEYPTFVGGTVNDSFIAELDTDDWTAATDGTVTAPHNFAFDTAGNPITVNTAGITAGEALGTTYGGATPLLRASTPITPGLHTLYLSIFDQGDAIYDSAAFVDDLSVGHKETGQCETGAVDAPLVTLDQPADGSHVDDTTPTLTGHGGTAAGDDPDVNVRVYQGTSATGTPIETHDAAISNGAWSATAGPLANGTYTAQAVQRDSDDNFGTSEAHTFTVGPTDTEAPRVSLVDPGKGAHTTDKTPEFNGVAGTDPGDSARVTVEVHSGDSTSGPVALSLRATRGGGGGWHVSPRAADALRPGDYTAQAVQADTAGNVGRSKAHRFTIDPLAGDFANLEVSVTQSAPPILVGRDLTFSVHVRNRGPGVATDVTLTDMLPEGAGLPDSEARSASRAAGGTACSRSGREMTCTVGSLAAGHSADFDFVVVPRRSGVMANTASVAGTSIDTVTASNTGQARPTVVRVPKIGKTIDAAVVKGTVRYRKRGAKRFRILRGQVELPVGSLVDATKGRVRLTAERKAGGALQTADFYRGSFLLRQRRAGDGLTTLDLRGGTFQGCPKAGQSRNGATVARKRRHRRRLWGSGHGRFRTRGRFGSATVRGTVWYTQDACRSTYFKTRRGVVSVRNYVKKKTVKVPAGQSYYARAPRP